MKAKILKLIGIIVFTCILIAVIVVSEIKSIPALGSIFGTFFGFAIQAVYKNFQDLSDKEQWEITQRKLQRGKIITPEEIVRISFAYLFRIKVGDKYLLVKNERGTNKYQPVGGVYQVYGDEKTKLKELFHVIDDSKIPIDKSSKNDYRMQLQNRYLRQFIARFDNEANRENVNNLGREFKEEIIEKKILDWDHIEYRFCGRHISDLTYGNHFRCYELLLADIVEILPTEKQYNDLEKLITTQSDIYRFATAEEIKSLGINTREGILEEKIADHTQKILQENENYLISMPYDNKHFSINI